MRFKQHILAITITLTMLTPQAGVNWFNDGLTIHKETYYNLSMKKVVANAASNGIPGFYWERGDGMKMYGVYIIVAANHNNHPYGSIVMTSRGPGIVLDTGTFAKNNPEQYDLAVTW